MRQIVLFLSCFWLLSAGVSSASDLTENFVVEPVFNTKIRIVEAGQEHPLTLVLVHGVGQEGATIWRDLIPDLARSYHVIACDLPGFGQSGKPNALYSPERFSEFLHWLIDERVPDRFILAGHSLGGALALHYAATAPVKPDKLILIDVAGILHRAALAKFLLHLDITTDQPDDPSAPFAWLNRLVGTMIEKVQSLPVNIDRMMRSPFLRKKFLEGDPNKIAGLALIQTDFTLLIDQVETPTIVIWGESDEIAPLRTGRLLAARMQQAQLEIITDGGHTPMHRQPELFRQTFWSALQSPPVQLPEKISPVTDRVGRCVEQKDVRFSGYYQRIELSRCQNVQLVDVTTEELSVTESTATIQNSRISGEGIGLNAVRSRIIATVLDIEADLPIQADQTSFDFAGVTLKSRGEHLVVGVGNPSRLLFSVSHGLGPQRNDRLHEVVAVTAKQPF